MGLAAHNRRRRLRAEDHERESLGAQNESTDIVQEEPGEVKPKEPAKRSRKS